MTPAGALLQIPTSSYSPTISTKEPDIVSMVDFDHYLARYIQTISHLQALSRMDVDEHFRARQREIVVHIDEAVAMFKGLVRYLRLATEDIKMPVQPVLDGYYSAPVPTRWCSDRRTRLIEECDRGIRVMMDGIDQLEEPMGLCLNVSGMSLG